MSITISGSTGISGVDGSSTTPAFQGTDTNTGLFYGTDIVGISTGGSERVRVDSSGNVGIGTTSPSSKLTVASSNVTVNAGYGIAFTGDQDRIMTPEDNVSGALIKWSSGGICRFSAASTERMRIDSSGNVLVGKTSTGFSTNGIELRADNELWVTKDSSIPVSLNRKTSTGELTRFHYNGTKVGDISTNGTGTTYNSSSDYRLKENILPMTGALDKVAQLKPVTYTWKADGSNGQGFIAHELQEVVPDCVTGEKDAVNEDGSINPQGIDTSKLVATLTAAIQEQQTIINDLKARVTALEASNV